MALSNHEVGHHDGERQSYEPGHFAPDRLHEHEAEADEDDGVENLPDQPDSRRGGSSAWFGERVVPGHPIHVNCSFTG